MSIRKEHLSGAVIAVRDELKALDEFSTFIGLGSTDEVAALAAIDVFSSVGSDPRAVLWPVDYESEGLTNSSFESATAVIIRLERLTPDADAGADTNDQAWNFLLASESVIDGLKEAVVGRPDKMTILGVEMVTPPMKLDPEKNTQRARPFWQVDFLIRLSC